MAKLLNKFEVGCDPEFAVLDAQGKIFNVASAIGHSGPAGYDHNGKCAELRPDQGRGVFTLVKRMQSIIFSYAPLSALKDKRWRAGAYVNDGTSKVSLGGHVHFSFTAANLKPGTLEALDTLTQYLEEVEILPKAESLTRRKVTEYGKWGQIRTDTPDHHVEYRTMASWLFNPWIAFLALTCAKLTAVSPETTQAALAKQTSRQALEDFLHGFKGKDINVDRLLHKLERSSKWLNIDPDADIKAAWEKPLGE